MATFYGNGCGHKLILSFELLFCFLASTLKSNENGVLHLFLQAYLLLFLLKKFPIHFRIPYHRQRRLSFSPNDVGVGCMDIDN